MWRLSATPPKCAHYFIKKKFKWLQMILIASRWESSTSQAFNLPPNECKVLFKADHSVLRMPQQSCRCSSCPCLPRSFSSTLCRVHIAAWATDGMRLPKCALLGRERFVLQIPFAGLQTDLLRHLSSVTNTERLLAFSPVLGSLAQS